MNLRVRQGCAAIDCSVKCTVEFCNPDGVGILANDPSVDPVKLLEGFGFKPMASKVTHGLYVVPWLSSDDGDCYLVVI